MHTSHVHLMISKIMHSRKSRHSNCCGPISAPLRSRIFLIFENTFFPSLFQVCSQDFVVSCNSFNAVMIGDQDLK